VHSLQHEPRAAADLEQARRPGRVAPDQPTDQLVARPEPEVLCFELGELRERRRLETRAIVELGCEQRIALLVCGALAARRAAPFAIVGRQRSAREAAPQP
jgi:hypothetical protein